MAQFHFVEDYERHVAGLVAQHPIDEAMSLAVGGHFDLLGKIELGLLRHFGLLPGMSIFDLGCGSGRLAAALGGSGIDVAYCGTDVVQSLLDYAVTKTPPGYRFVLHRDLSVPMPDNSVDMACAFSVFTHLLHDESFLYLRDMCRVLRPSGRIIFSFLEFAEPSHWPIFESTCENRKNAGTAPLNTYIGRDAIHVWARHLGLTVETIIGAGDDLGAGALGRL